MASVSRRSLGAFVESKGSHKVVKSVKGSIPPSEVNALQASDLSHAIRLAALNKNPDVRIWREFSKRALLLMPTMKPKTLAFVANGFAKMNIQDRELFKEIAIKAVKEAKYFDSLEAALLLNSYAKMEYRDVKLFGTFSRLLMGPAKNGSTAAIIGATTGAAIIGDKNEIGDKYVNNKRSRVLQNATEQHLSLIVNAFARLEIRDETLLVDYVGDEILKKVNTFTPQGVSNVLHGFAKLDIQPEHNQKAERVLHGVIKRLSDFEIKQLDNQHIANILDACAKLGLYNENLIQKFLIERGVLQRGDSFSPVEVTACLSAIVRFPNRGLNGEAVELLTKRVDIDLERYQFHFLATVLNALSLCSTFHTEMRSVCGGVCGGMNGQGNAIRPNNVQTSDVEIQSDSAFPEMHELNRLQFSAKNRLFGRAGIHLLQYFSHGGNKQNPNTPIDVAVGLLLAAYARQHHFDPNLVVNHRLLRVLAEKMEHRVQSMSDQSLVNVLYAIARFTERSATSRWFEELSAMEAAENTSKEATEVFNIARSETAPSDHTTSSEATACTKTSGLAFESLFDDGVQGHSMQSFSSSSSSTSSSIAPARQMNHETLSTIDARYESMREGMREGVKSRLSRPNMNLIPEGSRLNLIPPEGRLNGNGLTRLTSFSSKKPLEDPLDASIPYYFLPILSRLVSELGNTSRISCFIVQHQVNTLFAIGKLHRLGNRQLQQQKVILDEKVIPTLIETLEKNIDGLSPQQVSNLFYGLANLYYDKSRVANLYQYTSSSEETGNQNKVKKKAVAFAKLLLEKKLVVGSLMNEYSPQFLGYILQSMALFCPELGQNPAICSNEFFLKASHLIRLGGDKKIESLSDRIFLAFSHMKVFDPSLAVYTVQNILSNSISGAISSSASIIPPGHLPISSTTIISTDKRSPSSTRQEFSQEFSSIRQEVDVLLSSLQNIAYVCDNWFDYRMLHDGKQQDPSKDWTERFGLTTIEFRQQLDNLLRRAEAILIKNADKLFEDDLLQYSRLSWVVMNHYRNVEGSCSSSPNALLLPKIFTLESEPLLSFNANQELALPSLRTQNSMISSANGRSRIESVGGDAVRDAAKCGESEGNGLQFLLLHAKSNEAAGTLATCMDLYDNSTLSSVDLDPLCSSLASNLRLTSMKDVALLVKRGEKLPAKILEKVLRCIVDSVGCNAEGRHGIPGDASEFQTENKLDQQQFDVDSIPGHGNTMTLTILGDLLEGFGMIKAKYGASGSADDSLTGSVSKIDEDLLNSAEEKLLDLMKSTIESNTEHSLIPNPKLIEIAPQMIKSVAGQGLNEDSRAFLEQFAQNFLFRTDVLNIANAQSVENNKTALLSLIETAGNAKSYAKNVAQKEREKRTDLVVEAAKTYCELSKTGSKIATSIGSKLDESTEKNLIRVRKILLTCKNVLKKVTEKEPEFLECLYRDSVQLTTLTEASKSYIIDLLLAFSHYTMNDTTKQEDLIKDAKNGLQSQLSWQLRSHFLDNQILNDPSKLLTQDSLKVAYLCVMNLDDVENGALENHSQNENNKRMLHVLQKNLTKIFWTKHALTPHHRKVLAEIGLHLRSEHPMYFRKLDANLQRELS